jgi:UDP-N-acetylmuramoyl-L-alanyl-D-glutamate--2,6-diaminopimelate ligase
MKVSKLISELNTSVQHEGSDPDLAGVSINSRQIRKGYLFAAVSGHAGDGWDYVEDALKRGAVGVLGAHERGPSGCPCYIRAEDPRKAFAEIADALYGHPSRKLKVVGVTGTNGKTTTAYMVRAALRAVDLDPGLIGTVAYEVGERVIPASRTTPDAGTIQEFLKQMVSANCQAAVMEVSSHALMQERVWGIDFDVGVFTNLTHDHLDYHQTMDAYYEAKARLFRMLAPEAAAVINVDDSWGQKLNAETLDCRKLTFGMVNKADVKAEGIKVDGQGTQFMAKTPWGSHAVTLRLLGRHNVSNALACLAACGSLGVNLGNALNALSRLAAVRGRLEPVRTNRGFSVYIDYAHTDDALAHALRTVRELTPGRLIVVFGCGGDRDRKKRPLMGRVASELADCVIITSDNPRSEEPSEIIDAIHAGADRSLTVVQAIEDRADAIRHALSLAREGDAVLIAGKGHETYQETGHCTIPFDDRKVAEDALSLEAGVDDAD